MGKAGFCSPFIHEEANYRLERLEQLGITTPPDTGDRHGDTHVHSPYGKVLVDPTQISQSFNITVPLLVNDPGNFFAIGALQFYTFDRFAVGDQPSPVAEYRYDVANALDMNLITYEDEPEILTLSIGIQIVSYVLIGVACLAILFLLYQTIKHQNNNIIRVSQGRFLILFEVAGLWASASAVLLEPKNDVYCNLYNPMIFVPLQLLFSITIGRLWRIQAVISPLLVRKLHQERSFARRFGNAMSDATSCSCMKRGRQNHSSPRRTVTSHQLARVVALFTLPQIILQIVGGILNPDAVTIDFNASESVGRQICESRVHSWQDFRTYSVFLLLLLFIVLLAVSYACRQLPSLLNETSSISNSTIESLIALIIGFAVIAITDAPTTSPDISYLVSVLMVLTLTLNSTWRIMLPKLRMVWRGETVVISKLVNDSRQRSYSEQESHVLEGVSGFTPNPNAPPRHHASSVNSSGYSAGHSTYQSKSSISETDQFSYNGTAVPYGNSVAAQKEDSPDEAHGPKQKKMVSFSDDLNAEEDIIENVVVEGVPAVTKEDAPTQNANDTAAATTVDPEAAAVSPPTSPKLAQLKAKAQPALERVEDIGGGALRQGDATTIPIDEPPQQREAGPARHLHRRRHPHPIPISDDETPSRRLVLRMVDLHLVLSRVNQRILSGLVVNHDDWKFLQEASIDLGNIFGDEVVFQWEQDEHIM